jgi:AcrR family transcriptional regulator
MSSSREAAEWGSARARLVRAAQELLIEEFNAERTRGQAVARAFAFLDPTVVAQRAGVARSAFYHHWGDPPGGTDDDLTPFQRFVGEVFETEWGDPYSADVLAIAATHHGTFAELMRKLSDAESRRYDDEVGWASWRSATALAAYGGSTEGSIDAINSVIAEFYEGLLARFGLRTRPPLTTKHVASAIMAVFDGLWLQRMYGVEDSNPVFNWPDPDTGEIEEWSLVGIAVLGTVTAMTEPDE